MFQCFTQLSHRRADNIVRDSEEIRRTLLGPDQRWSILGQSFGGFCGVRYLSAAPEGQALPWGSSEVWPALSSILGKEHEIHPCKERMLGKFGAYSAKCLTCQMARRASGVLGECVNTWQRYSLPSV